MKIPQKFQLFGQWFNVEYDEQLCHKEDNIGSLHLRENKVRLQLVTEATNYPKCKIEETFLHELVHAILHFMGERKLSNDERFVELFSGLLHQYIITAQGELKIMPKEEKKEEKPYRK